MKKFLFVIIVLLFNSPINMYAGSAQHTGQSGYKGPDRATNIVWSKSVTPESFVYVSPLVDKNGVVYIPFQVVRGPQGLMALTHDGKTKWQYDFKENERIFFSGFSLSENENNLYLVTGIKENTYLTAFSTDKGLPEWTVKMDGRALYWNQVIISKDNLIYFANRTGVFAVNKDGNIVWKQIMKEQLNLEALYAPALSPNEKILYLLSKFSNDINAPFYLYAIDAINGKRLWKAEEPIRLYGEGYETLAIDPNSGAIYVAGLNKEGDGRPGNLYAFNSNGTLKWVYKEKSGDMGHISPSVGRDGTVYIMTGVDTKKQGHLIAIGPNGALKWRYSFPDIYDAVNFIAIDKEEKLYFLLGTKMNSNNGLYCIDKNGKLVFRVLVPDVFWGLNPAISPDGSIYVFSEKGILYSIK